MATYVGSGGAEFEVTAPEEGTPARENFDRLVASGELTLKAAPKAEPKPAAKKAAR